MTTADRNPLYRYVVVTVYDRAAGLVSGQPFRTKAQAMHWARSMFRDAPEYEYVVHDSQTGKDILRLPERNPRKSKRATRTAGQSGGVHIDIDSHNRNPGKGTDYEFFGAFANKRDALKREREVGGFIVPRRIGGKLRHVVLRRYRANPTIFVAGNPGELLGRAVQLKYLHETEGPRYHDFDDGETRVELLPDKSVRLYNPRKPLWMDDGNGNT